MSDENIALSYSLSSLPRGKDLSTSIDNQCNITSKHVAIDVNGSVFVCKCVAWLPMPVGKVEDFDSLPEIWHSARTKTLQQDIASKKFTWCAVQHCGIQYQNILQNYYSLAISVDDSCNLACPSCRRQQLMLDQGPEFDLKQRQIYKIMSWLENFDQPIFITMTGNGDPLASKIMRPLIQTYEPKTQQRFNLKTNGLLLKKIMPYTALKKAIAGYQISVDAGSRVIYENVRRPGKWSVLLDNLEWLSHNRGNANVSLNFVIQRNNLDDIDAFIDLCVKYQFRAEFSALFDWGTWNAEPVTTPDSWTIQNGTFADHNVANQNHVLHKKFVEVINKVYNSRLPYVSLSPFFKKFLHDPR